MKPRFLVHSILIVPLLAAANLHAQVLPPTPTTPPSPQVMPQQDGSERVTATGCLKQERDVPGLSPNRAEPARNGEDFVLTNARLAAVAAPDTPPENASRSRSSPASSTILRIAGLDKDKLQSLLGQHVEVTGRLESAPQMTAMAQPTEPELHGQAEAETPVGAAGDLQLIRATRIRAIPGSCAGGTW